MNARESMALVVVGSILLCVMVGAGVFLKFAQARADAEEAGAIVDGHDIATGTSAVLMGEGILWPSFFREPYESLVFVFRDGSFMTFTTQDEPFVDAPIASIVSDIARAGRSVAECAFCVHNHFTPIGFTEGDERSWRYLKRQGFHGIFGVFYPATGRFRAMEGGE